MVVDIPFYMNGSMIPGATNENPRVFMILDVILRKKEELAFVSKTDKYEFVIEDSTGRYTVTVNDKTLANCAWKWGREEKAWIGKRLGLWAVVKSVFGNEKAVIYGRPIE